MNFRTKIHKGADLRRKICLRLPLLAALLAGAPAPAQDLPGDLPSCAAHGLTMAIIYFREAEVEGETEERRQYERAGMDLFEGSLALWAEETSCAPPDGQDVDYVWDHGAELLGAFDDAIANGADPAPLRGYYLAGWVQCVEMIGTDALAATNIDVATNGMPCGWGSE